MLYHTPFFFLPQAFSVIGKSSCRHYPDVVRRGSSSSSPPRRVHPVHGSAVSIALPSIATEFALDAVSLSLVAHRSLTQRCSSSRSGGMLISTDEEDGFTLGVIIFTVSALLSQRLRHRVPCSSLPVHRGYRERHDLRPGIAMITSVFPPEEGGQALGSTSPRSLSASPSGRSSAVSHRFTWRSIFLTNILGIYIIYQVLPPGRGVADTWEKFDVQVRLYSVMLLAVMFGLSHLPIPALSWRSSSASFAGAHLRPDAGPGPQHPAPRVEQGVCLLKPRRFDQLQRDVRRRVPPLPLPPGGQGV